MSPLDIVYTPLDLPPLKTNALSVHTWVSSVYPQKERPLVAPSYGAETILGKNYPWNICYGRYKYKWVDNFDNLFPEICDFAISGFGLTEEDIPTLVILPIKDNRIGPGFWHSDPDPTGLRFFIENENYEKNPIEFVRSKEPYEVRPKEFGYVPDIHTTGIFKNELLTGKILSGNQAFYINNIRAVHRPIVNVLSRRIAVIVYPGKDKIEHIKEKTQDLIIRSADKFRNEYSLYW